MKNQKEIKGKQPTSLSSAGVNMVHVEDPTITVITRSQAQEMEANRANQEGEPNHSFLELEKWSFQKDGELAQWGDLDIVTRQTGKAIVEEQAIKTLPNPNILMGLDLPKANYKAPPTTASLGDLETKEKLTPSHLKGEPNSSKGGRLQQAGKEDQSTNSLQQDGNHSGWAPILSPLLCICNQLTSFQPEGSCQWCFAA